MSRFLRVLAVFVGLLFVGDAFAATGYVCESYRKYTSCAEGYYMTTSATSTTYNGTPAVGNACRPCSVASGATFCPGGTTAPIYPVTLNPNGGTGGVPTTLYHTATDSNGDGYGDWYKDTTSTDAGTLVTNLTAAIMTSAPTRSSVTSGNTITKYTFRGYYSASNGGTQYISASRVLTTYGKNQATSSGAKTWYALWQSTLTCAKGYYKSGTSCVACPANTYQPTNGSTATSCTACPDGYTYAGTGASSVRSCTVTCEPGKIVGVPGDVCVTNPQSGTFTSTTVHTVAYGDVSPVNFCPDGFTNGTQTVNQCGACMSDAGYAGKAVSSSAVIQYIRLRNLSPNATNTIALSRIHAYANGEQIPATYSASSGFTAGVVTHVADAALPSITYNTSNGAFAGISNTGLASSTAGGYVTIQLNTAAPVDKIDVFFAGLPINTAGVIYYALDISADGENWTTIYDGTNATSADLEAMVPANHFVKKTFIPYSTSDAPEGYYAKRRIVTLCANDTSLYPTKCAIGSYTSTTGQSSCIACQNGTTTSAAGATSCNATCANAANASTWATATWSSSKITNLCTIATCDDTYVRTGDSPYVCSACACTEGDNVNACSVTGTNDSNQCEYSYTCATGYKTAGTFTGTAATATNTSPACTACTYTVAYNANGGSGTTASSTHTYDTAKTLTTNAFTRAGYTFAGWNTKDDGSGTSYADKASVTNLTSTCDGTVTLYAQWTAKCNTITLDNTTNGGTGGTTTLYKLTDSTAWYSEPNCSGTPVTTITKPSKTNATYAGHYTNGGSTAYITSAGALSTSWTVNAATTLYARYNCNTNWTGAGTTIAGTCTGTTYTITLNDNNGTGGSGTVKQQYSTKWTNSGGTTISSVTIPTRNGYVFTGYYTATSGGTRHITAAGALPGNTTFTADTTLYAQWSSCSCTNGTGATGCSATVTNNVCNITWSCDSGYFKATKSATASGGYTATCDSCTENAGASYTASDGNRNTVNTCYYTCTKACTQQTCPANATCTHGTSSTSGKTYYGSSCNASASTCSLSFTCNTGYSKNSEGTACEPNEYTITLDKNNAGANDTSTGTTTLYTRYNTNVYIDSARSNAMTTSANGITKPTKVFTVTYNPNDGSVSPTSANATSTFAGYYSTESSNNGSGTQYVGTSYITSDGLTKGKSITANATWYAKWTAGTVTLPTPTRTGYTFNGWYTAASGGTKIGNAGATYTPTANITLYAQWNANTYTVSYDLKGGSFGTNHPTSASFDNTFTVNNPTHTHGTFAGWKITGMDGVTHTYGSQTTTDTSISSTTATSFKNLRSTSGTVTFTAIWTCSAGYQANDSCGANTIELSWNNGGHGTVPTSSASSCTYGSTFTAPAAMTATGYTFSKWSVNNKSFSAGATINCTSADLGVTSGTATITGTWNANSGTKYVVNHYTKNLGASTYTLHSTDNYTGTTGGTLTLANLKTSITGFTYSEGFAGTATKGTTKPSSGAVTSTTILADGTRVIDLYYTRNTYAITVTADRGFSTVAASGWTNTGTASMSKSFEYEASIALASVVTPSRKTGYTGTLYSKTSGSGTLSGTTFTVGAGVATITVAATGISAPTAAITPASTTKVYNYEATTLTAKNNTSYDSNINVYYSFGSSSSSTGSYSYGTASTTATTSVGAASHRGTKYYKVQVYATDGALTSSTVTSDAVSVTLNNKTITFDANSGTLSGSSSLYAAYATAALYTSSTGATEGTIPTASKTGYTFKGWYTAASGGNQIYNASGTLTSAAVSGFTSGSKWVATENKTLYAQWTANTYTVTLRDYSDSSTHSTIYQKYATGWYSDSGASTALSKATVPTRSGYKFRGFYTAKQSDLTASGGSGTRRITNDGTLPGNTTFSANTNLYAAWAKDCTKPSNGTCSLTINSDGTATYTASCNTGYTVSGATTATPSCNAKCNAITLDANGGTAGSVAKLYKKTDATGYYTDSLCETAYSTTANIIPTRSGYTFRGFYISDPVDVSATETNGVSRYITHTGAATNTGTNWTVNAPKTLYAGWAQNCAPGNQATCTLTVGQNTKYTTGCNAGYNIKSGSSAYNPVCQGNTITLSWANGGHGTVPTSSASSCTYGSTFTAPAAMTATGYTFGKWSVGSKSFSAGATINCTVADLGVTSGTATITGTWNAHQYTVTFKTGDKTMASQTFTYGTAQKLTAVSGMSNIPVSGNGWSFVGWSTAADSVAEYTDAQSVSNLTATSGGSVTLYGVWKRNVTFKYYDGASATSVTTNEREQRYHNTSATAASASGVSTYALATQSTYEWTPVGWVLNSNTSTSPASTATTTTTTVAPAANAAAVYTALYKRTVTVAYNGNSNTSGSTSNTTGTQYYNVGNGSAKDLSLTLANNGFVRTGYAFSKWAIGSTSGAQYAAGASYTFPNAWSSNASATMYAIWTLNSYSITISKNGGSGTLTVNGVTQTGTTDVTFTCSHGDTFTLPAWSSASGTANQLTRTKMVFTGWSVSGTVTCDSAKTISAQWTTPTCTAGTGVASTSLSSVSGNAPVCSRSSKCGYYCSATQTGSAGATSLTTTCTKTDSGYYAAAGATTQTKASAGYYAAAGACEQTACGDGKWSAAGSATCGSITAGCYGTSASSACPNECAKGTYSTAGAASCTNVNAGCYADSTGSTTACPKSCSSLGGGSYKDSAAGSDADTDCYVTTTAGKYLTASDATAQTPCPAKQYCESETLYYPNVSVLNDGGWNDCPAADSTTKMPASSYPDSIKVYNEAGTVLPTTVNVTSFSLQSWTEGYKAKTDCRAVYTFTNDAGRLTNEGVQFNADTGKYDRFGEANNYYGRVNSGYYVAERYSEAYCNNQPSTSTRPTYYSKAIICPAGSYCPGITSMPKCYGNEYPETGIGKYSCATDTTYYTSSAEKSDSINSCYLTLGTAKFVETAGADQKTCTAGGYCDKAGTKIYYGSTGGRTACGAGKWSAAGSATCSSIDAGCYGTSAGSACPNECTEGTYSTGGAASCTNARDGYYVGVPKATADTACVTGSYSEKSSGSTKCVACPGGRTTSGAGTKYNATANTACSVACSGGTWVNSWKTPVWHGPYSAMMYENSMYDLCAIDTCKAGSYADIEEGSGGGMAGQSLYASEQKVTACTACATGTYMDSTAHTETSCKSADAGYYVGTTGASSQTQCDNWTFSTGGAASCTSCPAPTNGWSKSDSTSKGWTSYTSCKQTQKPANCASGGITQTATSATAWGTSSVTTPLTANENFYVGATSCPSCSSLGGGLYNKSAAGNSGGASACKATVTAGSYLAAATDKTLTTCTAGYYCPGKTLAYSNTGGRTQCPAGYRDGTTGYSAESQCLMNVAGGKYVATPKESSASGTCAMGYAKAQHTVNYGLTSSCDPCTEATYADTTGQATCTACPTAVNPSTDKVIRYSYWNTGKDADHTSVEACQAYFDLETLDTGTARFYCYVDTNSVNKDTNTATYGIDGSARTCFVRRSGATCNGGYYNSTFAADSNASQLAAGTTLAAARAAACTPVESGYWSPANVLTRTACPSGYVNGSATAAAESECAITVTGGHYIGTAGDNSDNWDTCAKGYAKAQHTVNYGSTSSCDACTGATYADDTGLSTCSACPTAKAYPGSELGYYWDSTGLHTTEQGCNATIVNPTISHGTLTSSLCYLDENKDYGTANALRGSWGCAAKTKNLTCDGGYYTTKSGDYAYRSLAELAANSCTPVESGYWSPADVLTRTACPSGYVNGSATAASESECAITVPGGHYIGADGDNSDNWDTCANWTYKPEHTVYYGQTSSCTACPTVPDAVDGVAWTKASGTGWDAYNDCVVTQTPAHCASGSVKKTASTASAWGETKLENTLKSIDGYYANSTAIECSAAQAGYFATAGATNQTACVTGSYTSTTAQSACIACGDGENWGLTTTGAGQTSCNATCSNATDSEDEDAVNGWMDASWNENNTVSNLCIPNSCKKNHFLDGENAQCPRCDSIANGMFPYSSNGTTKGTEACYLRTNEIPGQYVDITEDDEVLILPCPKATFSVGKETQVVHYGTETSSCTSCSGNTYQDEEGQTECKACPAGYTAYYGGDDYDGDGIDGDGRSDIRSCRIICQPGAYIANAGDSECTSVGAGYWAAATARPYVAYGDTSPRNQCPSGLTTIGYGSGADEAGDCGRILHVGDGKMYLRSDRKTTPSLNIKVGNTTFYGNMTNAEDKYISHGVEKSLKVNYNDDEYSVYDDSGESYIGGGSVSLTLDPSVAATSGVPAKFGEGTDLNWSVTMADGTVLTGVGGCDSRAPSDTAMGAIAEVGFEPDGTADAKACWCKMTSPNQTSKWVLATNNANQCETNCSYFCASGFTGVKDKNVTFRTNIYNLSGISTQ